MEEKLENPEEWNEVEEEYDDVNYVKWEQPGTEVIGVLKDIFQGKDAKFAKVDTGAEILTMFTVPSILDGKLKSHVGKAVKIVYVGTTKFKSGRHGKDFKVFVRGDKE